MNIENKKTKGKKCFIITPIGEVDSEIFRKAKGVIDSVIKPVLQNYGFTDIKPSYEIMETGLINNQIIDRIINDDLVVANLTGSNPNVMYELAIRHASAKPIIHLCERGTVLPFDIKDSRTSFFKDDMLGVQELRKEFESFVLNLSYENEYVDNPIYNGVKMANFLGNMSDEGRKVEAELLTKIYDYVSNNQRKNNYYIYENPKVLDSADLLLKINIDYSLKSFETLEEKNRFSYTRSDFITQFIINVLDEKGTFIGCYDQFFCFKLHDYHPMYSKIDLETLRKKASEVASKYGLEISLRLNDKRILTMSEVETILDNMK